METGGLSPQLRRAWHCRRNSQSPATRLAKPAPHAIPPHTPTPSHLLTRSTNTVCDPG
jgi:hypothetical protein